MSKFLAMGIFLLAIQSCENSGEQQTASGLKYKMVKQGEGEPAENGDYLILNMEYSDDKDSVWVNTAERGAPMVILKQDSVWKSNEGSIEEIFVDLKKGDSVVFDIDAVTLFGKTWRAPMPPGVDSTSVFTFKIGVSDVVDEEGIRAWQQEMMEKQESAQLKKDTEAIEEYLSENNIDAQTTESGIRYIITQEGEGEKAQAGDTVKVNYTGYVLNGEYFDSSVEEVAKEKGIYNEQRAPYEPFTFTLGQGSVIRGWDEGITLLSEGGKATLYIPSTMAYGPRRRSAAIGPNSILVFDVELVDIVD